MRAALPALALPLALAACGQPYTRDDGSFDRGRYREHVGTSCRVGLATNSDARGLDQAAVCACAVDRLERGQSDTALHARIRARDRPDQEISAVRACWQEQGGSRLIFDPATGRVTGGGRPADPAALGPEDEPPPDGLSIPPPDASPEEVQNYVDGINRANEEAYGR